MNQGRKIKLKNLKRRAITFGVLAASNGEPITKNPFTTDFVRAWFEEGYKSVRMPKKH